MAKFGGQVEHRARDAPLPVEPVGWTSSPVALTHAAVAGIDAKGWEWGRVTMHETTRKRVRIGLWATLILAFLALLGHNIYLTAHRPRYRDLAAGYVEVLNNRGAINFITIGDAWVQRVLFGISVVAFLGVAWLDFSRWYRRTVPKIKGL